MSGLTQKDKSFFINRISREIENKIEKAKKEVGYDRKEIEQQALRLTHEKFGVTKLVASYDEKQKAIHQLQKEKNALEENIQEICDEIKGKSYWRDWSSVLHSQAKELIPQVEEENYPELMEEVRHLEKVLYDSEAVIRIVTTSRRLQDALTSLLENYEIELEGLENSIPEV